MRVYKFLDAHFALKCLYERRLRVSTIDDLNDPFELLPYDLRNQELRSLADKIKDSVKTHIGLICFSGHWHDPVVWAHYSDKHRGIGLGFDVPDNKCLRVKYEDHRLEPAIEADEPEPTPTEVIRKIFGVKFANWKYEDEIRMVGKLTEHEDGVYYINFDPDLELKEVIAGVRCSYPLSGIERALGGLSPNVKKIKAMAGYERFEIVEDPNGWK